MHPFRDIKAVFPKTIKFSFGTSILRWVNINISSIKELAQNGDKVSFFQSGIANIWRPKEPIFNLVYFPAETLKFFEVLVCNEALEPLKICCLILISIVFFHTIMVFFNVSSLSCWEKSSSCSEEFILWIDKCKEFQTIVKGLSWNRGPRGKSIW